MTGSKAGFLMLNKEKIAALLSKKEKAQAKLAEKYKNFHGVRHENSVSELRYVEIKVLEDFIASIEAELATLQNNK